MEVSPNVTTGSQEQLLKIDEKAERSQFIFLKDKFIWWSEMLEFIATCNYWINL